MLWSLNYLGLMYCKGTCINNRAILLPLNHHNFIYLFITKNKNTQAGPSDTSLQH